MRRNRGRSHKRGSRRTAELTEENNLIFDTNETETLPLYSVSSFNTFSSLVSIAPPVNNLINGTNNDDYLIATNATDDIYAMDGNDFIIPLSGVLGETGIIDGGDGLDSVYYGNLDTNIYVSSNILTNTLSVNKGIGGINGSDFLGDTIERVIGSNYDDHFRGTNIKDIFEGKDGNDTMRGLGGDDIINGGNGDDNIKGDAGNDILYGGNGNDALDGGTGNDIIYGGAGHDFIKSGQGNDTIISGDGIDYVQLTDLGFKTLDYNIAQTTGGINIKWSINADELDDGFGNTGLITGKIEKLIATDFDDIITSSTSKGAEYIAGLGGDDTIIGTNLDRGDKIYGGNDHDFIDARGGNDLLQGNNGNDTLLGGVGRDFLLGQNGDDTLNGGLDFDTLIGGAGADTFIFDIDALSARDTINDFDYNIGGDIIDLSDLISDYDPIIDSLSDFVSVSSEGASAIISVDIDGSENAYCFEQVVALYNVSASVINLDDMVDDGSLVVA